MALLRTPAPVTSFGSTGNEEGLVMVQANGLQGAVLSSRPTVGVEQHPVPHLRPAKEHLGGIKPVKVPVGRQAGSCQGYHRGEDV